MYTFYFFIITYPALKYILNNDAVLSKLLLYQKKINHIIEITPDTLTFMSTKSELINISELISSHHYLWYSEHAYLIYITFFVFSIYDPIPIFPQFTLSYPPDDWQIIILLAYWIYMGYFCNHSLGFIALFIKAYNTGDTKTLDLLDSLMPILDKLEEGLVNNTLTLQETTDLYLLIISILKDLSDILYALPIG